MKKIGVIGSGQVAQVLANGFLKHGYQVRVGSRDVSKLSDWKAKAGDHGSIGTFADAAHFAEMVVLAVAGTGAEEAVRECGFENLRSKTVIDVTNPIAKEAPVNGVLKFFTNLDDSLMEKLQRLVPEAHFVKAFNSVGNALMVNPQLPGGPPSMFICGNDDAAKQEVRGILNQFGWETEDLGKAEAARAIEPLCILWCIPGFLKNDWMHAYKVLR